jgi:hypothetical protein
MTPDQGGEEIDEHDDVRAVDGSPLVNLTTCKKTALEVKTHDVDHVTTHNLHHHALGRVEEATRHLEVPIRSSRRGGVAAKGAQGARPTTTQTSS